MRFALIVSTLLLAAPMQAQPPFPKKYEPKGYEIISQRRIDNLTVDVDPGGPILHRPGVQYPSDLLEKKASGKVIVEAQLNDQGEVVDAVILSGPMELRRPALQAILQWHYALTGAQKVRAIFVFSPPPALPMQMRSETPGPGAPLRRLGRIDLTGLPESLIPILASRLAEFEGKVLDNTAMEQIRQAVKAADSHYVSAFLPENGSDDLTLRMFLGSAPLNQPRPTGPVRVGPNVQAANLLKRVEPTYPAVAAEARIQGTVRFNIIVSTTGTVANATVESGHPLLIPAALEAVKQWTFRPTLLNGQPVEVQTTVDVNFKLP